MTVGIKPFLSLNPSKYTVLNHQRFTVEAQIVI